MKMSRRPSPSMSTKSGDIDEPESESRRVGCRVTGEAWIIRGSSIFEVNGIPVMLPIKASSNHPHRCQRTRVAEEPTSSSPKGLFESSSSYQSSVLLVLPCSVEISRGTSAACWRRRDKSCGISEATGVNSRPIAAVVGATPCTFC